MGSLGDCAPTASKKEIERPRRRVKFNSIPTITVDPPAVDPDENLIFHMIDLDFKRNCTKKAQLYDGSSTERKFIRALAVVIHSNYGMYEKLYGYANGLHSYNTELCQIVRKKSEEQSFDSRFPDSKTFNHLVKDKDTFKQKLILLLSWLEPSYKMNENLLRMMNSMDADTKIDSKLCNQMIDESIKVGEINGSFKKVFQSFPMEGYRKNIDLIRKATKHLQFGKFDPETANRRLEISVPKVHRMSTIMKNTLKTALTIEFEELYAATKKFHDIVMEELKVGGDARAKT